MRAPAGHRYLGLLIVAGLLAACGAGPADRRVSPAANGRDEERLAERRRMVDEQLRARDIRDARVLAAMERVPRHRFVPAEVAALAYGDHPLPIGFDQTISQPYIVAYMTEALAAPADARVLEIGTGSGYQAAVLAELVAEVYTIEIVPPLASRATETLDALGYTNVHVLEGDGYLGWPEHAPFDAVMVTAAPDHIPEPLVEQLRVGGRLVIPVGRERQDLLVFTKTDAGLQELARLPVRFVPLTRKPG